MARGFNVLYLLCHLGGDPFTTIYNDVTVRSWWFIQIYWTCANVDHIIPSMVFFSSPSLGYLMFGLYPGFKFDGEVRQMTWFSAWWLIAGHSIHVNHVSPLVSPWITTNHHSSSLFTINHHYSPHSSPLIITIHQFRVWPPESTKAFEPSDPRRGQPREEWPQWPTANTVTWGAGDVFQDRNGGDKFFFFLNIYIYILFIYIYGFTTKI
jgi:hypothetical protein